MFPSFLDKRRKMPLATCALVSHGLAEDAECNYAKHTECSHLKRDRQKEMIVKKKNLGVPGASGYEGRFHSAS